MGAGTPPGGMSPEKCGEDTVRPIEKKNEKWYDGSVKYTERKGGSHSDVRQIRQKV